MKHRTTITSQNRNSFRATSRGLNLVRRGALWLVWCSLLVVVATGTQAIAQDTPSITVTKEFPNSQPAYYSISVREDGTALYRTSPEEEEPIEFRLPPDVAQEIFSIAHKLNLFRDSKLESKRRVASMGKKTLIYQRGAEHYETMFNHTEVPEAVALTTLFERISQTQQHSLRIEYLIRFDRLGVVKELLQLEANLDQGRLLNPAQLLPLLEQIRENNSLIQMAQGRAAQIIAKIQSGKP